MISLPQKKFKIIALGCRTNQYEAQAYRDQLLSLGYVQAGEEEHADLCIVNTCTVTESADGSSRHEIRQLAQKHPGSKLVVTGCSVERQKEKIESISGVTHVIPNAFKETLLDKVFPEEAIPEFSIQHFEAHTRAFVKVQDGCNSFCTYCIIPYVRGRSRSRKLADIIHEVENLIRNGFKEIVLTGINIGDFDGNPEEGELPLRLADLVRAIDPLPGLERLRLSSIDPDEVDADLLDAIIRGRTTCPSMHIVLQSGSNVILKRMNRKYTRQIFLQTVERLRSAHPDFTFTTDVIVGFPGETDIDFEETLEVMREVRFAKVHMFPYSPRPRTRAALYPGRIPQELVAERKQRLLRAAEQISYQLRQQYVGRKMRVLMESDHSGHTENFLPVNVESKSVGLKNEIIEVLLERNTAAALEGTYQD